MEDIIDIIVTETTNTIEITSQATDEIIDVNIIDNREDITLNVTPSLVEININSLTGNFGVEWGDITGTLADQTDLNTALGLKADLVDGKVPSSQLPSYVDDIVEVANYAALPATGETGKIYVVLDTNKIYRWSGSAYIEIADSTAVWGAITGTLSSQTDLQNALNAKFDDPTGDTTQYIAGDGSLITFPVAGQAGTLVREVRNTTGATLTKGTIVYISGATGNKPTVSKAIATGDSTSAQTFGMCQANISNNSNGYVVCVGDITGLDTSAVSEGVQLYLSSTTAGEYTTTKQLAPAHLVYIGVVTRSHPTLGQIEVKIQNGYELDEIHDVAISSVANNQGLFYESSTSLWKNKSIATVLGGTPITGSGTTNYIPKFTAASALGDSNIQDNGTLITLGSNTLVNGLFRIGSNDTNVFQNFILNKNLTGAASVYGFMHNGVIQTDVTSNVYGISSFLNTASSSFTVNTIYNFFSGSVTLGSSSSVTNQMGYFVPSTFTSAVNNYGFYGSIASGTNRFNIYMAGTANNYLNGNLGIGIIPSAWTSGRAIEVGAIGNGLWGAFNNTYLVSNFYFSTTNKFAGTGYALNYLLVPSTGEYQWQTSNASGLAGNNITFSTLMSLKANGNLLIGSTSDNGSKLQVTGGATISSSITANSFIKSSGTSSQFLKADGSIDSSTYLTTGTASSTYVPYTGATAHLNMGPNQGINSGQFLLLTKDGSNTLGNTSYFGITNTSFNDGIFFQLNTNNDLGIYGKTGGTGSSQVAFISRTGLIGGTNLIIGATSGSGAINITQNQSSNNQYLNFVGTQTSFNQEYGFGIVNGTKDFRLYDYTAGSESLRLTTGGNLLVGINSNSSSSRLVISGATYSDRYRINDTAGGFVTLEMENSTRWRINYLGRFGGYGAGALTTDASGNITAASDRRLKDVIKPIENVLENIMDFEPVYFKWNDKTDLDKENVYMSTIAQSIELHYPDAIGHMPDGSLTVQDRAVTAILVQAIKELKLELDTLKNK